MNTDVQCMYSIILSRCMYFLHCDDIRLSTRSFHYYLLEVHVSILYEKENLPRRKPHYYSSTYVACRGTLFIASWKNDEKNR